MTPCVTAYVSQVVRLSADWEQHTFPVSKDSWGCRELAEGATAVVSGQPVSCPCSLDESRASEALSPRQQRVEL